jgi:hypothetical protein
MTTLQQAALTDTRLQDLIDEFTRKHRVEIVDGGRTLGHRWDDALLVQLRHAKTTATTYAADPGASQRHSRTTINARAVALYGTIERQVRSWALAAGYTRQTGTWSLPEAILTAWYARSRQIDDLTAYTAALTAWKRQIGDLLDPPHRFDIDQPCPICHVWVFTIDATDEQNDTGETRQVRALTGIERTPNLHRITCRACKTEWDGLDAAQELADELAVNARLDRIAERWHHTLQVWDELTRAVIEARA